MAETINSSLMKTYTEKLDQMHEAIDPQALGILKRLKEAGSQAYLVGGCVRDLLVGIKPKDFDIATDALPNVVKKKVPYSFIIGRRFKLVHARRGEHIYEIATFRRAASAEEIESTESDDRLFTEENFFGNIEEDSFRRDFTVNALFYDPISRKIVDHCHGLDDIRDHSLRMIGDPETRLKEDPIRILRAIRLSQKISFSIAPELRQAILDHKVELKRAVIPRRREEWLKFFRLPQPDLALMELFDLGLMEVVLPTFHNLFSDETCREEFLSYVRQFKFVGIDLSDPTALFSAVIYSYLLASSSEGINPNKLEDDEPFLLFCRDELGVFKAEVATLIKTLQFMPSLKKIAGYQEKGERRQYSMVHNSSFEFALQLGLLSHFIVGPELLFWFGEKERFKNI